MAVCRFDASDGVLTKSRLKIRREALLTAKTVRILPTVLTGVAAQTNLTETERRLVSNAIDRALCLGLSDRFDVLPPAEPADLTIRAMLTPIGLTDKIARAGPPVAPL